MNSSSQPVATSCLSFCPHTRHNSTQLEIQWRELKRLLAGQCFESLEDLKDAIETIVAKEMKSVKLMSYLTDEYKPP